MCYRKPPVKARSDAVVEPGTSDLRFPPQLASDPRHLRYVFRFIRPTCEHVGRVPVEVMPCTVIPPRRPRVTAEQWMREPEPLPRLRGQEVILGNRQADRDGSDRFFAKARD